MMNFINSYAFFYPNKHYAKLLLNVLKTKQYEGMGRCSLIKYICEIHQLINTMMDSVEGPYFDCEEQVFQKYGNQKLCNQKNML